MSSNYMDKQTIIILASVLGGVTLLVAIPSIFYARATPEGKETIGALANPFSGKGKMLRNEIGRQAVGNTAPPPSPPRVSLAEESHRNTFYGQQRNTDDELFGPLRGGKLKRKSGKNRKTKRRKNNQTHRKK